MNKMIFALSIFLVAPFCSANQIVFNNMFMQKCYHTDYYDPNKCDGRDSQVSDVTVALATKHCTLNGGVDGAPACKRIHIGRVNQAVLTAPSSEPFMLYVITSSPRLTVTQSCSVDYSKQYHTFTYGYPVYGQFVDYNNVVCKAG